MRMPLAKLAILVTLAVSTPGCPDPDPPDYPGDPHPACASSCAVQESCAAAGSYPGCTWSTEDECVACCEANLDLAVQTLYGCAKAWEDLAMCQGTLDCASFALWQSPASESYPCASEDYALSAACAGGVGQ